MLYSILAMAVCVIFSGYFSATETAFSTLNKTRMRAMAEKGNRRAKLALELSGDYDKLISTILIGNNIVNIAVAAIGTVLFIDLLGEELGATVSTAVVTVVVLIFGEITPKSVAKDYPERFAMFSAPIIRGIVWFFTPLNFLFSAWKKLVGKMFGGAQESKMSPEELRILLDEVEQEGGLDASEGKLLRNALEFGQLEAQDILTHRVDLEGISVDDDKAAVAQAFDQSQFSRLLVYEDTMDKIVGVLHRRDFYVSGGVTEKPLSEVMSRPIFIHQTENIDDLLQLLRDAKTQIAVVVDEYGGTLGIVTMEDILEELVGEIWDEHDVVREPIRALDDGVYLVSGSLSLDDFCEEFHVQSDSDSVSVGGWVMEVLDRIPREGEEFDFHNLHITVSRVDKHRVTFIRVTAEQ